MTFDEAAGAFVRLDLLALYDNPGSENLCLKNTCERTVLS